jgi:hypothetical protein
VTLKLLLLALGAVLLAGCATELPHLPEMGFNWVSRDGRSQDQLYQDQMDCRREVSVGQIANPTSQGGTVWGMNEMKAFNDCMRSKGWVKE